VTMYDECHALLLSIFDGEVYHWFVGLPTARHAVAAKGPSTADLFDDWQQGRQTRMPSNEQRRDGPSNPIHQKSSEPALCRPDPLTWIIKNLPHSIPPDISDSAYTGFDAFPPTMGKHHQPMNCFNQSCSYGLRTNHVVAHGQVAPLP
jgi:hypothetical protein